VASKVLNIVQCLQARGSQRVRWANQLLASAVCNNVCFILTIVQALPRYTNQYSNKCDQVKAKAQVPPKCSEHKKEKECT